MHAIVAAPTLRALMTPSTKLERTVKADHRGKWSVRVNKQYRIVFAWSWEELKPRAELDTPGKVASLLFTNYD
jgi:plasmid maintenance system killer protein